MGGAGDARYAKVGSVVWKGRVLTDAIARVERHLEDVIGVKATRGAVVPCIDVVVPTYRCDVDMLRALATLECARAASVHTLIVVDKPGASTLAGVKALASYGVVPTFDFSHSFAN